MLSFAFVGFMSVWLPASASTGVSLVLNTSSISSTVSAEYVSFNVDWHLNSEEFPAWVNCSILNIDLSNPDLKTLAKTLSPAHLRMGGSEGDLVIFEPREGPACPPNTSFCFTADRWDQWCDWAQEQQLTIAYGLNSMLGRNSSTSPMNISNLELFLKYTASRPCASLSHLEFGNEVQTKVSPTTYASDVVRVRQLINQYWPDAAKRPKFVANDENPDASYWSRMLPTAHEALDGLTWHLYVGYGLDPNLPGDAWSNSFLAKIDQTAAPMISTAVQFGFSGAGKSLWVGETAMAWHSGRNGTTNTFLSGPWYITQLGTLAHTHATQCRQTFYGGNYELVDKITLNPNPDWWTALLWKRLMGSRVLHVSANTTAVKVFAHCTAVASLSPPTSVTLSFVNLELVPATISSIATPSGETIALAPRTEYILTADGAETSQSMLLNGVRLTYSHGQVGPTQGHKVTSDATPLVLPPHSYGYVVLEGLQQSVCGA